MSASIDFANRMPAQHFAPNEMSDRFGITFPSVGNSLKLALFDYSSSPAELNAAKEILGGNTIPKYSQLYGQTHLFRIHTDVTNKALDMLSNSAKTAGVVLGAARLGTIVVPITAIAFASLGFSDYAINSAAVYGVSVLTHMFATVQLRSEYAHAIVNHMDVKTE